jgi:hypothetical protein
MPFKSKAQRRKFAELLVNGEISPETYEEWNRDTGRKELPERVDRARKKGTRRKTAKRKTAKRKTAKRKTAKRKARKR